MEIAKDFSFEAAHLLPNLPESHKCRRLHGHSFRVEVHVSGELDAERNWVCDYADITEVVAPIIDGVLDHRYLNEIEGLENPTSEGIAVWLWERIKPELPGLSRIIVHETCTARAIYSGPG